MAVAQPKHQKGYRISTLDMPNSAYTKFKLFSNTVISIKVLNNMPEAKK